MGHRPGCDGYGGNHRPVADLTSTGTYLPACSLGCLIDIAGRPTTGSLETAISLAERVDHPWHTFDICKGC